MDAQNINSGTRNGRTNWSQQMSSPNNILTGTQGLKSHATPTQSGGNQRYESLKQQNWIDKLGKRNSFQDLSSQPESCNSSDSSSSSRSSTPNKHCTGSQAESSDDRESLSSLPEFNFKYALKIFYKNVYSFYKLISC